MTAELPWFLVSGGILLTIIVTGIIFAWRTIRELKSGYPLQDERTRMIRGRSATFAFYIGIYFMVALMIGNIIYIETQGNPILDAGYALDISVLVQSITFLAASYYFKRLEDNY